MTNSFLKASHIAITIFGTLVGAGFASGKEIWFYFARFGGFGLFSAFFVCVLFFFSCILFFSFGKNFQIKTVQQAMQIPFGRFAMPMEFLLIISNLVMLSSMFAGADSLFEIVVPNFPYHLAGVLSALVCMMIVCFGFRGITKTNAFVVPLLVLMLVLVLVFSFKGENSFALPKFFEKNGFLGIFNGLLFLGSNMFFAGFVFSKMGSSYSKTEILWGSLFGCFLLFLAIVLILVLLFLHPFSFASSMPVVEVALKSNFWLSLVVLFIIWLGLITTSLAMLYTLSNWLKTYFGSPVFMTALSCFVALLFSGIGFNLFVQKVYPIMAVFGFVLMLFVFLSNKQKRKTYLKKSKTKQKCCF